MRRSIILLMRLCLAAAIMAGLRCGNSAEVSGYAEVVGQLAGPDEKPAAYVDVTMRPGDYLPITAGLSKRTVAEDMREYATVTNKNGEYRFTIDSAFADGMYVIEALDGKGNGVFIDSVTIDEQFIASTTILKIPADTLEPLGSIDGSVPVGKSVTVYVFGIDKYSTADDSGRYHIDGVPEGAYQLFIVTAAPQTPLYDTIPVTIESGKSVLVPVTEYDTTLIPLVHIDSMLTRGETIVYNGNGNTAGTVPGAQVADTNGVFIIASGEGLLKGDSTFSSWNTAADGSGYDVHFEDTVTADDLPETLYVRWESTAYALHIEILGSGTVDTSHDSGYSDASTVNIRAVPDSGYRFSAWRVTEGTANVFDPAKPEAVVQMFDKKVTVVAVFVRSESWTALTVDSVDGYISNEVFSLALTADSGYVLTGALYDFKDNGAQASGAPGRTFAFVIRADKHGEKLWSRHFSFLDGLSKGNHIMQTSDGGFLMTGETSATANGYTDILVVKLAVDGTTEWLKHYGDDVDNRGYSALETAEGYVIRGSTAPLLESGSLQVLAVDHDGNQRWNLQYPVSGTGKTICHTEDGGYFLTAPGEDGMKGVKLIKISSGGNYLWEFTYGSDMNMKEPVAVRMMENGYVYLVGTLTDGSVYIVQTDADGILQQIYTDQTNVFDCRAGIFTKDGGFVLTGATFGNASSSYFDSRVFLARYDKFTAPLWYQRYGENVYNGTFGYTLAETNDGGFVFAGRLRSEDYGYGVQPVYLVKTNADGSY